MYRESEMLGSRVWVQRHPELDRRYNEFAIDQRSAYLPVYKPMPGIVVAAQGGHCLTFEVRLWNGKFVWVECEELSYRS